MRDHTHQFEMVLFLTASALFGIASMYASQFAPLLFTGPDRHQTETVQTPEPGEAPAAP